MDGEADSGTNVKALGTGIYRIWIGERPGPLAASLAYYALFSIVPIIYVALVIAGLFVDTSQVVSQLADRLAERLGPEGVLSLANYLVFGLLLMFSLAMIYKFLPNVKIGWRDVWVGSAVTAALIMVAIQLFGFLLTVNRFETALQAAGSVALFLISFYFLGTIFVFGAVFTRVYATLFGSHFEPRKGSGRADDVKG